MSDGYDYYGFLENVLPLFKDQILNRDGKFVIRPDSSPKTPYEIIVGDISADENSIEYKGTVEYLYELFGGTINSKGYKVLDSHIGLIYGEAISLILWDKILKGLMDKGFSSDNIVVGVGSASYTGYGGGIYEIEDNKPYGISRDTHGLAIKETSVASGFGKNQIWRPTFKDPKTDNGDKKSHRGFIMIEKINDSFVVHQNVTREQEKTGELETVYEDGVIKRVQSFDDVRKTLLEFSTEKELQFAR